jgi:NADH:ubiquinone oxidoreductase subunit
MKQFFVQFFTWWNGQTLGTRFYTWRFGERVGTDEFGNIYYRVKGGKLDPALGFNRRWVIFSGVAEATMIPPGWHGWLHHRVDIAPAEENYTARAWQKPHKPNMTGTPLAYHPPGSLLAEGRRPSTDGDYEAWTPGG